LRARHARKHLHRTGEIELRHPWKYHETDLQRGGHGEPFRALLAKFWSILAWSASV
jgi:hypothetical protein